MALSIKHFTEFYKALDASGLVPRRLKPDPFPWQVQLAALACAGDWPKVIALPTAAGKTAVMDIALFALAAKAPGAARRIFFVVDRRIVVDEAGERALRIAHRLRAALRDVDAPTILREVAGALAAIGGEGEPLVVATLRGGTVRDDAWARSPAQPAVCCATVDQVGSRLLFRGYGLNERAWPIHAGLVGNDALVIVDEAHCAVPFVQTLSAIAGRYHSWRKVSLPGGLSVVQMSATPSETERFEAGPDDFSDETLKKRFNRPKLARLVLVGKSAIPKKADTKVGNASANSTGRHENEETHGDAFVGSAIKAARRHANNPDGSPQVVGVILNRVATARAVFNGLKKEAGADSILLTGRVRPWDRDELLRRSKSAFAAGRAGRPTRPFYVVATQCIEVGANLDFDALITECASLDALRQRMGRLNRLGQHPTAEATILVRESDIKLNAQGEPEKSDPIYGYALAKTWHWLCVLSSAHRNEYAQLEGDLFTVPAEPVGKRKAPAEAEANMVDLSVAALKDCLPSGDALRSLCASALDAPVLLPAHLDGFAQTWPEPVPSPEVSVFLHGPKSGPADVNLVWRADFDGAMPEVWADLATLCPPSSGEMLSVPFGAAQRWLAGETPLPIGDVEGGESEEEDGFVPKDIEPKNALRWYGRDRSAPLLPENALRPGDTLLIPMNYGGLDAFGWNPDSAAVMDRPMRDLGDALSMLARGRAVLRLDRRVTDPWFETVTNGTEIIDADGAPTILSNLRALLIQEEERDEEAITSELERLHNAADAPAWMRASARVLADDSRRKVVVSPVGRTGEPLVSLTASCSLKPEQLRRLLRASSGEFPDNKENGLEDLFESDFSTAGDGSSQTRAVPLAEHQSGVAARAKHLAELCGLPPSLVETLTLSAAWHDVGKTDPRFQTLLHGGDTAQARRALAEFRPLAKSDTNPRNRRAAAEARALSGYPEGGRHELQSVALLSPERKLALPLPDGVDRDLFLHLIASHHGYCRPFAPVVTDLKPVSVSFTQNGVTLHASTDHHLAALGSGIAERFWLLTRRYGWFGLAWLEALLRLADHRQSEAEQIRDERLDLPF